MAFYHIIYAPLSAFAARIMQNYFGFGIPNIIAPSVLIPTVLMGILAGLIEEFGWRGFFLPRLLSRFHQFTAGCIIGIPWGLWHLAPAFWGVGSIYGNRFWLFFIVADILNLTAYSILMAYVCNAVKGRVQIAILFHASMSASINIFLADLPSITDSIRLLSFFSLFSWLAVFIAAIIFKLKRYFSPQEQKVIRKE